VNIRLSNLLQVEQHWQGASDDDSSDTAGPSAVNDHAEGSDQQEAEACHQHERAKGSNEGGWQEGEGQHGKSDEGVDRDLEEPQCTKEASHADSAEDSAEEYEVPDEAYIMAYLGRHVCPQELPTANGEEEACGGTMTPVGVYGDTYACNMCGFERLESERLAELEKMYQAVAQEVQQ